MFQHAPFAFEGSAEAPTEQSLRSRVRFQALDLLEERGHPAIHERARDLAPGDLHVERRGPPSSELVEHFERFDCQHDLESGYRLVRFWRSHVANHKPE